MLRVLLVGVHGGAAAGVEKFRPMTLSPPLSFKTVRAAAVAQTRTDSTEVQRWDPSTTDFTIDSWSSRLPLRSKHRILPFAAVFCSLPVYDASVLP